MRVLPIGVRAVLLDELGADPAGWASALRSLAIPGVVDVVPAACTVLVSCDDQHSLAVVRQRLDEVVASHDDEGNESIVEIAVRYDGEDLAEVAATLGLDPAEVMAIHTAPTYRVAFCGFAPGFAYLSGTDPRLALRRRSTPRTAVPAGSVAVAAGYTAVYPRASPGGWHLLGTTDAVMFDPDRSPAALLEPGARVRMVIA